MVVLPDYAAAAARDVSSCKAITGVYGICHLNNAQGAYVKGERAKQRRWI
ncbi:MAG TPA: hypothetical protein HA366_02985 [Candidatus Methanomethylophilaceae archaeon]|nr:hypothetical protein [Candidatus Methanomethylophilaceae archaeon]